MNARSLIKSLALTTIVVYITVQPVNVHCSVCGKRAEKQPRFIYWTAPLPDVVHFTCVPDIKHVGFPYSPSYPKHGHSNH